MPRATPLPLFCILLILYQLGCGNMSAVEEIRPDAARIAASETSLSVAAGDWPWWRGPGGNNVSQSDSLPVQWSRATNVRWSTDVPGRGHSSPSVWGDRVLLTTADEDQQKQILLAYDRQSGDNLWQTVIHEGDFTVKHGKNSHASATPACDGQHVVVAFINGDALYVTATDLKGNIVWQREAGPFKAVHGYGSSPVIYQSLVIVNGDNADNSFLAALDVRTGEIVWRVARERTGEYGNYATPSLGNFAGETQLVLHGNSKVISYDPASGEELWSCDGPSEVAACTSACSGNLVFASGGYPEKEMLAIRPDGRGDVTGSHVAWKTSKNITYVPSPVYDDGLLYVVNDQGIATCYEADSGSVVWQERLGGNFSASPVLAAEKIYVSDERGTTYVLRAGRQFEILAENKLEDVGFASPVIIGNQILLRAGHRLYSIAE